MKALGGKGSTGVFVGEEVVFDEVVVQIGGAEEGRLVNVSSDFAVGAVGDDLVVGVIIRCILVKAHCASELAAESPHERRVGHRIFVEGGIG